MPRIIIKGGVWRNTEVYIFDNYNMFCHVFADDSLIQMEITLMFHIRRRSLTRRVPVYFLG